MSLTQEQKNAKQREYRKDNQNSCTKAYEKTINGFLMRMYRNMQSRVMGIQKPKAHLYVGKDLLSRESFYSWAKNNESFYKLWDVYISAGYERKLAPTVDRVDSDKGYTLDNMEWVSHSENSRRGSLAKAAKNLCNT